MKYSYMVMTLKRVKRFQQLKDELGDDFETVRDYVLDGKEIPEDLKKIADEMIELRTEGIKGEMYYLAAYCEHMGVELPKDFIDGTALDPFVEPALYDYGANFDVLRLFSWYNPLEEAMFNPRKIVK